MKNADDIRTEAIALLVEKLREIGAEADRETKRHREAEKSPSALADFYTFADHREAAALNYALAYRCEQLCEEITGALLFDELDAQDETAEQAAQDAETGDEAAARENAEHDPRTCTECRDQWEAEQREDAEQAAREAEDGDETHFTRAQMDGEACTECGAEFAEGEATVPSAYDIIEGQLFAHLRCAQEALGDVKAAENPGYTTQGGGEL